MDRPVIRCLVCWFSPVFGVIDVSDAIPDERAWPKVVSLEEAADLARAGFSVLVDPQDERDLAMYERFMRSCASPKWFERSE